jgi:hypothetical protein
MVWELRGTNRVEPGFYTRNGRSSTARTAWATQRQEKGTGVIYRQEKGTGVIYRAWRPYVVRRRGCGQSPLVQHLPSFSPTL